MRTCTDCGETKSLDAFLPIKGYRTAVYGRCRACRNKRARERYHADPAITAAERARALKNFRLRQQQARTD